MNLKNKINLFTQPLFSLFVVLVVFIISLIFFPFTVANASSGASSLGMHNERVQPFYSEAVLFSWETSKPSTSKVIYGDNSNNKTAITINYGYEYSTKEVDIPVTKHSMLITGLSQGVSYSFRPVSVTEDGLKSTGNEKSITLINPCTYLKDYLKMGGDNNIKEVEKLQTFLRDFEGFSELKITGVFDQATFDAVSIFQVKYKDDILTPWGIDIPTGYVYYTTQNKINELYCNEDFSLDQNQVAEISNFKTSLKEFQNTENQDKIDFNTVGVVTIPIKESNEEPLREIKDVKLVTISDGQDEQIIPIPEVAVGTTTQTISSGSIVASILNATKNGISAVFDSVRNFFKKDDPQKENLNLEEGSDLDNLEDKNLN